MVDWWVGRIKRWSVRFILSFLLIFINFILWVCECVCQVRMQERREREGKEKKKKQWAACVIRLFADFVWIAMGRELCGRDHSA